MRKINSLIWIGISLVVLVAYALLIDKYFSPWQNEEGDYIYTLLVPITLVIPLLFRKYNYYKLAFLIFLFETITAVLTPSCYVEMAAILTIEVLWIPSVGIGLLLAKKITFRNKWIVTLVSFIFTYTMFPATLVVGQAFNAYFHDVFLYHFVRSFYKICS